MQAEYQFFLIEPRPIISIVIAGEIRSLSMQFKWGKSKIDRMRFALNYLDEMPIDSSNLVEAYATFDSYSQRIGKSLGKNDLWIAATAMVYDARLVTTDRDFDCLDPHFIKRDWISPVV